MTTRSMPRTDGVFTLRPRAVLGRSGLTKLITIVIAMAILFLVLYPAIRALASTFAPGGSPTAAPFQRLGKVRGLSTITINTVIYVATTLVMSVVIGALLAWVNERTNARMSRLASLIPLLPLMMPPLGTTIGYLTILDGRAGLVNQLLRGLTGSSARTGPISVFNMPGMVAVSVVSLAPIAYLIIGAALRNIDPALDEASRVYGASPWRTLRSITTSLVAPAIGSAALLVGILSLNNFPAPYLIGTQAGITVIPVLLFRLFSVFPPDQDSAVALSVFLLLVVLLGLVAQSRLEKTPRSVVSGRQSRATLVELGRWRTPVRATIVLYWIGAVVLPLLGLLVGSFEAYPGAGVTHLTFRFISKTMSGQTFKALEDSLLLGGLTATIVMAVAALLVFMRSRLFGRMGRLVEGVLLLPAAISPVVIAVIFLVSFSGAPFYLYGSLTIVLLSYVVLFLPWGSRSAAAAVSQVSDELLEASYVSGRGLGSSLFRIVLPNAWSGLWAGWVIVFLWAVNEVTASSFLSSQGSPVIGGFIIDNYSNNSLGEVTSLALIVTIISAVAVMGTLHSVSRVYQAGRT